MKLWGRKLFLFWIGIFYWIVLALGKIAFILSSFENWSLSEYLWINLAFIWEEDEDEGDSEWLLLALMFFNPLTLSVTHIPVIYINFPLHARIKRDCLILLQILSIFGDTIKILRTIIDLRWWWKRTWRLFT